MRKEDLTGCVFGKLTVLHESGFKRGRRVCWHCLCECGKESDVQANNLKSGNTTSCGHCHDIWNGRSGEKLYSVWDNMRKRCSDPNGKRYKNYGGRGISVCEEWKNNYLAFAKWAEENGYEDGLTIDRINNDGNYEPSNCRWTDRITQANNRTTNVIMEYKGFKGTIADICREFSANYGLVIERMNRGRTLAESIETKPGEMLDANSHLLTYNGETHTVAEWGRILGFKNKNTLGARLHMGWSAEKALTTPLRKRKDNK